MPEKIISAQVPASSGFSEKLGYEDYARCVHCGLCLNHCPTYRLWGREADSPRGRIRQMMLVDEGKIVGRRNFCSSHGSLPGLPRVRNGLSVWRGIRKVNRARARADSTGISPSIFFACGAGFLLPESAAISAANRGVGPCDANLSALRNTAAGACVRRAATFWTGRARKVDACHRPRILFLASR